MRSIHWHETVYSEAMAPTPSALRGPSPHSEGSGELALIERIRRRVGRPKSAEVRLGIGDDCAILRPRPGEEIVVTTDLCLEGRHFRRDWHSPASVGHRTLARGLSDLAAMGARPVAAFLSLALPRAIASDSSHSDSSDPLWLNGFLDGLLQLAAEVGVTLAGGDTAEAPGDTILADIVLLGAVPAGRGLRRSGARAGDRLFCTGLLGGSAAELRLLAQAAKDGRASSPASRPARTTGNTAAANPHPQLFPEPRLATGRLLLRRTLASAAMDLSDGLSTDLRHLCEASDLAAEVWLANLPLHPLAVTLGNALGAALGDPAIDLALHGGEDYELLFAARPAAAVPKRLGGVSLTEIGRLLPHTPGEPRVVAVASNGLRTELAPGGWEHLQ